MINTTVYAHPELDEEKIVNQDSEEIQAPDPDTVIGEEDEEEEDDTEEGAAAE